MQMAWMLGELKLYANRSSASNFSFFLFNISADPTESTNLIDDAEYQPQAKNMTAGLEEWLGTVDNSRTAAETNCNSWDPKLPKPPPAPGPLPAGPVLLTGFTNMIGADSPRGNSSSMRFLGLLNASAQCAAACKAMADRRCFSWTWHHTDHPNKQWAAGCYARLDVVWGPSANGGCDCGVP